MIEDEVYAVKQKHQSSQITALTEALESMAEITRLLGKQIQHLDRRLSSVEKVDDCAHEWPEDRIDIIGQNGNDGLHYSNDGDHYEDK